MTKIIFMASTFVMVAAGLAAVVTVVLLLSMRYRKKSQNRLIRQKIVLAEQVWKNKLEITETEAFNDCVIAVDRLNFVLLFIDCRQPKERVYLIDLWEVKSIAVMTDRDDHPPGLKPGGLQLRITLEAAGQSTIRLPLYHDDNDLQAFINSKKRADHWSRLIDACIREIPHHAVSR